MTLIERITKFAQQVGTDIGALTKRIGNTSTLTTTNKGNVVDAINEVKSTVDNLDLGLNETTVTNIATQKAKEEVAKVVGGAPAAFDTLKELADAFQDGSSITQSVVDGLNNRLRFDEVQMLDATQKLQACNNLGIGNPDTDLLAVYNTAKGA